MRTKLLMTSSAIFMAGLGVAASFFPDELIAYTSGSGPSAFTLLISMTGALYLGFAFLNWMVRESLLGGIYGRPIVIGNFGHFMIGALALLKTALGNASPAVLGISAAYALFAVWFALALFGSPVRRTVPSSTTPDR